MHRRLLHRVTTRRRYRAFERAVHRAEGFGGSADLLAAYRRG